MDVVMRSNNRSVNNPQIVILSTVIVWSIVSAQLI